MEKALAFKIEIVEYNKNYKLKITDVMVSSSNKEISVGNIDRGKSFDFNIPKHVIAKHSCLIQDMIKRKKMIERMLLICPYSIQLDNVRVEIDKLASKKMDLFNQEIFK